MNYEKNSKNQNYNGIFRSLQCIAPGITWSWKLKKLLCRMSIFIFPWTRKLVAKFSFVEWLSNFVQEWFAL